MEVCEEKVKSLPPAPMSHISSLYLIEQPSVAVFVCTRDLTGATPQCNQAAALRHAGSYLKSLMLSVPYMPAFEVRNCKPGSPNWSGYG